jgi:hypothetical protein
LIAGGVATEMRIPASLSGPWFVFLCALALQVAQAASSPGLLVVANKGEQTLGIVDPQSGRQVATVAEDGVTGHEVIASPDGRLAYVPIYGNSGVGKPGTDGQKVDVIDIATRKITGTIDFGRAVRPHCPQFGPRERIALHHNRTRQFREYHRSPPA